MKFDKVSKTIDEQIELLRSRGIVIKDENKARHLLTHINYYRLGAYWLPFEKDHENHVFKSGTKFEDVINLYIFDRKLRILVLDAIERIEVSCRTQWAYFMAHNHGCHSYLDSKLGYKLTHWQTNFDLLKNEIERSKEVFIEHYKSKYTDPEYPPIWSIVEVMSLGLLSRWLNNLKPLNTRKNIAQQYKINHKVLTSFLCHLTEVRNISAHHSRLWNRKFTITFTLPQKPVSLAKRLNKSENRRLFNTLIMLNYLLNIIEPHNSWFQDLTDLLLEYQIPLVSMGFPQDYNLR